MTVGPAFILALAAAALATGVWWIIHQPKPAGIQTVALFVFGLLLALVVLAGPLIKLP